MHRHTCCPGVDQRRRPVVVELAAAHDRQRLLGEGLGAGPVVPLDRHGAPPRQHERHDRQGARPTGHVPVMLRASIRRLILLICLPFVSAITACNATPTPLPAASVDIPATAAKGPQTAVFAGGCFWGIQSVFQHTKGVISATSGYAGGFTDKPPSYEPRSPPRTHGARRVGAGGVDRATQISYATFCSSRSSRGPRSDAAQPAGSRRGHVYPVGALLHVEHEQKTNCRTRTSPS